MFFDYEIEKKDISEYFTDTVSCKPSDWKALKKFYSDQEIKQHLTEIIKDKPFPLRRFLELETQGDWTQVKSATPTYTLGTWNAPRQTEAIELTYKGRSLYFTPSNKGQKVSNQFTQEQRMCCGYHNGNSPMFEWQHPNKPSSFLRCLFGILKDEVKASGLNNSVLYRALKMHTYMASQFKPETALALYNFFGAKRILDFSAGWGDRLVGFLASNAESYIGIDPNTKLHEPYEQIVRFCDTNKATRFICSPAEDADLSDVKVDFVFTSPPYFDIERYSDEDTQSWKRYRNPQQWIKSFLLPTLTKCYEALEEGGRIAINIADKKGLDICSPMIDHMESLGATYEGVIGYKMQKRNGMNLGEVFCEPIFVWSKGEAPEPKWHQDTYFGV
jgi:hypothetical protein